MQASTVPEALDRAWFLIQNNRFDRAEEELRQYLSKNSDTVHARVMLEMCLFDLNRDFKEIESVKQAISLVPDRYYPYWSLGRFYILLNQLGYAEKYLLEAIELDPLLLKQLSDVEKYLLEAIKLDPKQTCFCASLSELYWYQGSARNLKNEQKSKIFHKGIEIAKRGLEIESGHASSMLYLIRNLIGIGGNSISEAIEFSENLLSLEPESAASHEVYAIVLAIKIARTKNKQDLNRALKIIEESLHLDPNYAYIKYLSHGLLVDYFRVVSAFQKWRYSFLRILPLAAPLLLIVTFGFYNTLGIGFITIISALATLLSLLPWVDTTQSLIRAWLNPEYRKFLMPEPVIYLFWLIFAIITVVGVSCSLMSISLFNFFYLLTLIFVGGGGIILILTTIYQETKSQKTFLFYVFIIVVTVICMIVFSSRRPVNKNKQTNRVVIEMRSHSVLHESIEDNLLR
jgi:tetratricopeptide (TPR) repeat protein